MVKFHYKDLFVILEKHGILLDMLFSGFFISLFTSINCKSHRFIYQFWDIILLEKWKGVIKVFLFIID